MKQIAPILGLAAAALALTACDGGLAPAVVGREDVRADGLVADGDTQVDTHLTALSASSGGAGSVLVAFQGEATKILAALVGEVGSLEQAGALTSGQADALRNHLESADRFIQDLRFDPGLMQLRSFRLQVGGLVNDALLTPTQAQPLLEEVARLISDFRNRFACPDPEDIEEKLRESLEDRETHPALSVDVGIEEESPVVDEPVTLLVRVGERREPVLDADVQARVRLSGGYCTTYRLLDDGSGADGSADDGTYTAVIADFRAPGSYRLLLTVTGVGADNQGFNRARLLSLLVRGANPEEASTTIDGSTSPVLFDNPIPPRLFYNPIPLGPGG